MHNNKNAPKLLTSSALVFLFISCHGQPDSALQVITRDGDSYLTPLGCLLYGPWQTGHDRYNKAVYYNAKEISSVGVMHSKTETKFGISVQEGWYLFFWFKEDYDSSLNEHLAPKDGLRRISDGEPSEGQIKIVFKTGNWHANFVDSTLIIEFGKDGKDLPPLIGRYKVLGSSYMQFQKIELFDSTYNGKVEHLKRIATTYYDHPWIHNF